MSDGGNTCDTNKVTLSFLIARAKWRFHYDLRYRLKLLTGFFVSRGWPTAFASHPISSKPHPDPSPFPGPGRPTGFWFWTKQYARNLHSSFAYRFKASTGYYENLAKCIAKSQKQANVRRGKITGFHGDPRIFTGTKRSP